MESITYIKIVRKTKASFDKILVHLFRTDDRIEVWSRNSLLEAGVKSESLSDCNWTRTHNHLVHK